MQKNNFSKLGRIVNLFREAAQRPFVPFFLLMVILAATALCIFFYFQNPDLSGVAQDQPTSAPDSFDAARAQKYLKIFSIIKQNKNDYDQMATSTYSGAFKPTPEIAR
jgi:predicted membrane-bound mannosyltransferase